MIKGTNAQILLLLALSHTTNAWTTIHTSKTILGAQPSSLQFRRFPSSAACNLNRSKTLFSTEGESDGPAAPKRKRRRKKKVQVVVEEDEAEEAPANETIQPSAPVLDLKPREDAPVQLEVKNIVASTTEPEPSTISKVSSMLSSVMGSRDDSSSSVAQVPPSAEASTSGLDDFEGRSLDDSLGQLLEDARLMTEEEKDAQKEAGMLSDEEGTDLKKTIGNVLSTIVTADFFVVCGFLVWFLLGIFCSYILKDDTVQIAFNNNFETLVQPALGVLMIAAIGGNFFKEEEQ